MEEEIFNEIKEAEKKAEEITEKANIDADRIVQDAKSKASRLLSQKIEEIDKEKLKKIQDFRDNIHVLRDTKISEISESIKKMKQKAQKSMENAVEFTIKKFYESINGSVR